MGEFDKKKVMDGLLNMTGGLELLVCQRVIAPLRIIKSI